MIVRHCPVLHGVAYQRHPYIDKHDRFIAVSPDCPNRSRGWDLVGMQLPILRLLSDRGVFGTALGDAVLETIRFCTLKLVRT